MNHTEQQIQRALVCALPDKLTGEGPHYWHEDGTIKRRVTNEEWPAIVAMVEDGLTDSQQSNYIDALSVPLGVSRRFERNSAEDFKLMTAWWPARAQALADIGAITVKEEQP